MNRTRSRARIPRTSTGPRVGGDHHGTTFWAWARPLTGVAIIVVLGAPAGCRAVRRRPAPHRRRGARSSRSSITARHDLVLRPALEPAGRRARGRGAARYGVPRLLPRAVPERHASRRRRRRRAPRRPARPRHRRDGPRAAVGRLGPGLRPGRAGGAGRARAAVPAGSAAAVGARALAWSGHRRARASAFRAEVRHRRWRSGAVAAGRRALRARGRRARGRLPGRRAHRGGHRAAATSWSRSRLACCWRRRSR